MPARSKQRAAQTVYESMEREGLKQGPQDLSERMAELSAQLKEVWWRRHDLVVRESKRLHQRMNAIREMIEEMPADLVAVIPAARWMIDNFQLIYREIRKLNYSTTGYSKLPVLSAGLWQGQPRVHVILTAMVDMNAGYLSEQTILQTLKAYQEVDPLTDRELQVLPEMAGLAILLRIQAIAEEIIQVLDSKMRAYRFVQEQLGEDQEQPDIPGLLAAVPRGMDIHYHSHVLFLLRNLSVEQESVQRYIDSQLSDSAGQASAADVFREEGRLASLLESAIRNPVTSLRELGEMDEDALLAELSAIEQILSTDPAGVYTRMDNASKAGYRAVVEKLAIRHSAQETAVAQLCVDLAVAGHEALHHDHHVGTYLVGKGYPLLKQRVAGKAAPTLQPPRAWKGPLYFSLAALLYILLNALLLAFLPWRAGGLNWRAAALLFCALPLLLGLALRLINALFTRLLRARNLPAMDYEEGVPDEALTLVVMPVIIFSKDQALDYVRRLHKHSLANRQRNLHFALLADYADADAPQAPGDSEIREALIGEISRLNERAPSPLPRFSLLIRERRYNPSEGRYICWERKRGKLEEFNRLLSGMGRESTSFADIISDDRLLANTRYVITLDADSDLALDNAARLVGIIDHPLNRAVVDEASKRVIEGYAIIQPQVMNHISPRGNSLFQRMYAGRTGLPNYTMAISDIYQDVFQAGIFVGKGIYDVRAFHQILGQAIPENRVLSHDLLESCYARTAFAGNAHVVENFPGSFEAYAKRQHRWIRGDWQLLPWLVKRDLTGLSKWKIVDDLRASLVPAGKLAMIFVNLLLLPQVWWLWLLAFSLPLILDLIEVAADILTHWLQRQYHVLLYRKLLQELRMIFSRAALDLVMLPYEAYNTLNAIAHTLYRYLVSRRHFLQWDAADQVERTARGSVLGYFRRMWPATLVAGALSLSLRYAPLPIPAALLHALIAAAWAFSFLIAQRISRTSPPEQAVGAEEDQLLRGIARKTWRFFLDYTTEEGHMLCPDNVQLGRREQQTFKTSPTNIGLQFLAALSAWDLGFETLRSTLDYAGRVMETVASLPTWQGHLYNWYDTRTLKTLSPHYVSTVDSGNFLGYLLTLRGALEEMPERPAIGRQAVDELRRLLAQLDLDLRLQERHGSFTELLSDLRGVRERLYQRPEFPFQRDMQDAARLSQLIEEDALALGLDDQAPDECPSLQALAQAGQTGALRVIEQIESLRGLCGAMADGMSFRHLYNRKRKLFHIGFNVANQTYDSGCYDLIASESLLTSLLAIARGDVPAQHWQRLGRPLTIIDGRPTHVSWSGTMFEYLMPQLVVKEYQGSVFEDSSCAAVLQQQRHARALGIPWGMSESQYYRFDINQNYLYKAFGVPKLRLQPVYEEMQIISPYSTLLALEYAGPEAIRNLKSMAEHGATGEYGYFEAIDFTVPDPVTLKPYCVVRSFMAHHLGMSLAAINNRLSQGALRERFHRAPMIRAAQTLLEEKHQSLFATPSRRGYAINFKRRELPRESGSGTWTVRSTGLSVPSSLYVSDGSYAQMITSDGDGFSQRAGTLLHRWRPDVTANTGVYVYLRDRDLNSWWTASYHPARVQPDRYQVSFTPHHALFSRRDKGILSEMTVSLAPESHLSIRRLHLRNLSARPRTIELTSYLETAIDSLAAETSHPAFNRLFIETEYWEDRGALFASRRGRPEGLCGLHFVVADEKTRQTLSYENSRARFIGRNRGAQDPEAMAGPPRLAGEPGYSGDPIMSLRVDVRLRPGEERKVYFLSGLMDSAEAARTALNDFAAPHQVEDALERFRQQSQVELNYLDITGSQLRSVQSIIRQLYYPYRYYRGPAESIRRNWLGQSGLWKFGISGDVPILLAVVRSASETRLVQDVLKVYEYMRINLVRADLVIVAQSNYGYASELNNMITGLTGSLRIYDSVREQSGIYVLHSYEVSPQDMDLLYTIASVVFTGETGVYFRKHGGR